MSITTLIPALYRAYQAGQIIRDPARWKSGQELGNYITIILTGLFAAIIYFYPGAADWLSEEMKVLVCAVIVAALGIANNIMARITTKKKVGVDVLIQGTEQVQKADQAPEDGRRAGDQ